MNVYDFDRTLYPGDASLDFWRWCLRRHPATRRFLPGQLFFFGLWLTGLCGRTRFKAAFFAFLRAVPDVPAEVAAFWAERTDAARVPFADGSCAGLAAFEDLIVLSLAAWRGASGQTVLHSGSRPQMREKRMIGRRVSIRTQSLACMRLMRTLSVSALKWLTPSAG